MKRENGAVLHTKYTKGLGILVDTIIGQFSKIIKEFIYERSKKSLKIGKIAKFFKVANPGFATLATPCHPSLFTIRKQGGKMGWQVVNFKEIEETQFL